MSICKYCLCNDSVNDILIFPCKCKNPVHINCLREWLLNKEKYHFQCEICKDFYKYDYIYFMRPIKLIVIDFISYFFIIFVAYISLNFIIIIEKDYTVHEII